MAEYAKLYPYVDILLLLDVVMPPSLSSADSWGGMGGLYIASYRVGRFLGNLDISVAAVEALEPISYMGGCYILVILPTSTPAISPVALDATVLSTSSAFKPLFTLFFILTIHFALFSDAILLLSLHF